MSISRLFILRPIATSLLMIAIMLIGWAAYRALPVSALPDVDFPTLQITTNYPGASAQLIANTITAPLEKQFALMPGLTQMESTSSQGISVITLSFHLDLPLDIAEQQVQASINAASNLLPTELPFPPIYHKVNPADTPILTLAISSDDMTERDLQLLVENRLMMQLSQVSGVGLIGLAGNQRPAIRIEVNPTDLTAHHLSLEQIRQAIMKENVHISKGSFEGRLRASSIDANDQLMSIADYEQLIISYQQGKPLRLKDVAQIKESAEDTYRRAWYQGQRAVLLNVYRQPNSNIIATAERVKQQLTDIKHRLPASLNIDIASDRTLNIRAMMSATQMDLWLAIALVVAIIWLFLRQFSLTIIPALTIPLSLLMSLTVLSVSGFSINLLSLLALIIATGFVVDDSIVMLENINRHQSLGKAPIQAAIDGAQEITITIIALTLALLAVLIPLLFMENVIGRLFYEFALTLAVALVSSALISLTLTPMLAARLTPKQHSSVESFLLERVKQGYIHLLSRSLHNPWQMLILNIIMIFASAWLFYTLPKAFFPMQDTNQIQGELIAEQNASFEQVQGKLIELSERLQQEPNVESVMSFTGLDAQNASPITGKLTIQLINHDQRNASAPAMAQHFEQMSQDIEGIHFHSTATQSITLDTHQSSSPYQIRLSDPDKPRLAKATQQLTTAMQQSPLFLSVHHSLQEHGLGLAFTIDRENASRLGISTKDINNTLYNAFGQRMISTLFGQSNQQRVILTLADQYRASPSQLNQIYVPNNTGELIPLSNLVQIEEKFVPLTLEKYDQFPATHIAFELADGIGLNQALAEIDHLQTELSFPNSLSVEPNGVLAVFMQSQGQQISLFLGAIIAVYILLGMLYESFIHPLTILSTLLPATLGGLISLLILQKPLDMMAVIGMVLLIGIVMKNAIMVIDFALSALREQPMLSAKEAITQACHLRFRPILMTTFAALLAALPLVLSTGMGSELRDSMGIVIIGGLLLSQLVTLFSTPAIFLILHREDHVQIKRTEPV